MTGAYVHLISALSKCTFLPGSWDKRFARDMAGLFPGGDLTEKQRANVLRLVHKYRRQLDTNVVILAQDEGEKALSEASHG